MQWGELAAMFQDKINTFLSVNYLQKHHVIITFRFCLMHFKHYKTNNGRQRPS